MTFETQKTSSRHQHLIWNIICHLISFKIVNQMKFIVTWKNVLQSCHDILWRKYYSKRFFDGKTPRESFWRSTKDVASTHYLAEGHTTCIESCCMSVSRQDPWKRWRCSWKRHVCLRTKVSSTDIRCREVVLLLNTSQSGVGDLFPSLQVLRYEFGRIQKLHERFEIWDRSARAISVVKENSIQYVRSLFFVSKIRQDVSFQYMIL